MSDKKHIDEKDLDELLRDLYLEENSTNINEAKADFIFGQEYDVKIDTKKEKAVLNALQLGRGGNPFKIFLIFGLVLGILCLAIWFYLNSLEKNKLKISENRSDKNEVVVEDNNPYSNNSEEKKTIIKSKDTFGRPKLIPAESMDTIKVKKTEPTIIKEDVKRKTVPFISEVDIIRYRKIKEQMISRLLNKDKGLYTHIPEGKTTYAGKEIILDGFTLRNVGITNLEYKTFLADLLSQKRNEDYLTAEIKTENWIRLGYSGFANSYFENTKYNDFPVVNVTFEGATLFCKWLNEEVNAYMLSHKIKNRELTIRLPYDEEWIYAARDGYAKIAFEKGYNTIYDITEGLVDKGFTKRAELVKKRVMRVDTLYSQFTTNHYGWSEKEMNDFFDKGFKYYPSVITDTIYVDRMKVLGKIGRVSEMTAQRAGSKIWLTGLSWSFKNDYQKLENEFKANLSSPFVGFRIVVQNPNDPEYKNPFW